MLLNPVKLINTPAHATGETALHKHMCLDTRWYNGQRHNEIERQGTTPITVERQLVSKGPKIHVEMSLAGYSS
jgi:hypothetical protein